MRENESRFLEATPATRRERFGRPPGCSATWKWNVGAAVVRRDDSGCRRPSVGRELARQAIALADSRRRIACDVECRDGIQRAIAPHRARFRMPERYPGKEREEAGPDRAREHL